MPAHLTSEVSVGEVVRVEADRGEDIGTIVSMILASEFNDNTGRRGHNGDIRGIIRLATDYEKSRLKVKADEEELVLKVSK